MIFGMPGALAVGLPEALDVLESHGELAQGFVLRVHSLHPGQVQQRVQEHRGVAGGKHEAVAVGGAQDLLAEVDDVSIARAVGELSAGVDAHDLGFVVLLLFLLAGLRRGLFLRGGDRVD